MAGVRVKENEPIESAIRRFKKQCEKAGILAELRKREHYEKPSVRKKKRALAPKKRARRRRAGAAPRQSKLPLIVDRGAKSGELPRLRRSRLDPPARGSRTVSRILPRVLR